MRRRIDPNVRNAATIELGCWAVGAVEGHEGLWLAAGFSGHGFMMAPAVGRRLADAITGRVIDPSLQELSIDRFGGQELQHELQIV